MFGWIHDKGFMPIFILLTFPFTPSILVCGLAAIADVEKMEYIWATILGKMIMVLSLSFIGYNLKSFFQQPGKSILLISGTMLISLIGRWAISRHEKRLEIKRLAAEAATEEKSHIEE